MMQVPAASSHHPGLSPLLPTYHTQEDERAKRNPSSLELLLAQHCITWREKTHHTCERVQMASPIHGVLESLTWVKGELGLMNRG